MAAPQSEIRYLNPVSVEVKIQKSRHQIRRLQRRRIPEKIPQ